MSPLNIHVYPLDYRWLTCNREIKPTCPEAVAQLVDREEFVSGIDELNLDLRKYNNYYRFSLVGYIICLGLLWLIEGPWQRLLITLCVASIYVNLLMYADWNDIERVRNHLPIITRRLNNALSFDLVNQKHEILDYTSESGRNQRVSKYYLIVYSDPTAMQQAMYMPPTAIPAAHASGESITVLQV